MQNGAKTLKNGFTRDELRVKSTKVIDKAFPLDGDSDLLEHAAYLCCRWADEYKYESIEDYKKSLQAECDKVKFPHKAKLLVREMTKRPFGFFVRVQFPSRQCVDYHLKFHRNGRWFRGLVR